MVSLDLVSHDRYGAVGLTLEGMASVEDILRRYTLIEVVPHHSPWLRPGDVRR